MSSHDDWTPCDYCGGEGYVVTEDKYGATYHQLCPRCCGDKGFGSRTWSTDDTDFLRNIRTVRVRCHDIGRVR